MTHICKRCHRAVDKIIPIGNAEDSAQFTELIGVPYPQYDYLCPSCIIETLDIEIDDIPKSISNVSGISQLISDIQNQKDIMIAVSTGGPRIQHKNSEYQERRLKIREGLVFFGLRDPNPYSDLWQWYGKWSSGDLPTYQSRRNYIANLYEDLLNILEQKKHGKTSEPPNILTGWTRVDRSIDAIRIRLDTATNEEEFQMIGLLCREALISLAQAVYNPSKHSGNDGVVISETDAKRMLERYFAAELTGHGNETARKHARASLDLANELQHKRTAGFRDAALCAEATRTVINIVAIISERVSNLTVNKTQK
jgi:hypothetical protein